MAEIYKPESSEMAKTWNPQEVEDKLYREWEENGYFTAHREEGKKPFTIVMPPPNITGQLHMGHALDAMLQDVPHRAIHRMKGDPTLWLPGTDHASHRDRGEDCRPAEGRGPDQAADRPRGIPQARLGLEEEVWRPHNPSAAQAGRLL